MSRLIILLFYMTVLSAKEVTAIYLVDGMMCGANCPAKVEQSLKGIDGVKTCFVDFNSKKATVTYDNSIIDKNTIAKTISEKTYFKVTDTEEKPRSFFNWLFGRN